VPISLQKLSCEGGELNGGALGFVNGERGLQTLSETQHRIVELKVSGGGASLREESRRTSENEGETCLDEVIKHFSKVRRG